jgi:hypothetical protein
MRWATGAKPLQGQSGTNAGHDKKALLVLWRYTHPEAGQQLVADLVSLGLRFQMGKGSIGNGLLHGYLQKLR